MLQVNKSLTHLDLSGNNKLSAHCIFEGLQHNSTLVYLNLSRTDITSDSDTVRSLTKMLQVNKSLTHLDLSGNFFFSDLGACCIFACLQFNSTMVDLNLSNTGIVENINPDTARSLTDMLQVNKSLRYLDLSRSAYNTMFVCYRLISSVFEGLEHNNTLLHLNLFGIVISDSDAEYIARALECNTYLQTLNISNSYLSDEGAYLILKSLVYNTALQELIITRNWWLEQGIKDFNRTREDRGLFTVRIIQQSIGELQNGKVDDLNTERAIRFNRLNIYGF